MNTVSAAAPVDWRSLLRAELEPILAALAAGEDVAPARGYRAEGYAQALVGLGITQTGDIVALLRACYAEALGEERAAGFRPEDFRRAELPAIPVRLPRAPVYPVAG